MPAYLVSAANATMLVEGVDRMIIFAESTADAKAFAQASRPNDVNSAWANATVTEITADTGFSNLTLRVGVQDVTPDIEINAPDTGLSVLSSLIGAGGSTYSVNDILTVVGGTATRAATFRVTSVNSGAVDGIELVDPGEYTVLPSNDAATTVLPDNGSGCQLTLTGGTGQLQNVAAAAVSLLNANSLIAGAAVDFGAGSAPLLTIASGSGGDDLGDKEIEVEARVSGIAIPGLVGTITDGGSATDVLSVELDATVVVPKLVESLRST